MMRAMCPNSALHARPVPSSTKLTCRDKFSDNVSSVHQVDLHSFQESRISRVDCTLPRRRSHRLLEDGCERPSQSLGSAKASLMRAMCPNSALHAHPVPSSTKLTCTQTFRGSRHLGFRTEGLGFIVFFEYCSGLWVRGLELRIRVRVRV